MPLSTKATTLVLTALPLLALSDPRAYATNITLNTGVVNLTKPSYGTITINGGTVTVATSATSTPSLTFGGSTDNWTGTLDLLTNKMIVEPTSSNATLLANLQNQAKFGASHSTGILSSTRPANMGVAVMDNAVLGLSTFGGLSVDANSLLLSPELLGDANADGHVDLTDLSTVLNNFGTSTPAWTSGNFDFSSTIDLTDLSDVLNNFGLSNTNSAVMTSFTMATPAPEPASLSLLLFSTAMFQLCRRRKV
ncbi:MAG TPA: PEP-CTERM sorting domain-containing protein [Phycisphaerae bacterium]|nr:PEP-CTERM sorting domain-containing protein [Phycisphaerae bacterium]